MCTAELATPRFVTMANRPHMKCPRRVGARRAALADRPVSQRFRRRRPCE